MLIYTFHLSLQNCPYHPYPEYNSGSNTMKFSLQNLSCTLSLQIYLHFHSYRILLEKMKKQNQTNKRVKIPTPLPGVGIGSSTLLQRGVLQQWDTVWTPSLVEGEQTNGLSRGIRSISAIHILLRIILSAVRVTEAKHTPSVIHVKLSFVHSWQ